MEIVIKDLKTGEVIGILDSIPTITPKLEAEPQCNEVVMGLDLAIGESFTGELKLDWLNALCLFPNCIFTNNFLKYHGRPMVRRKHLRRERYNAGERTVDLYESMSKAE